MEVAEGSWVRRLFLQEDSPMPMLQEENWSVVLHLQKERADTDEKRELVELLEEGSRVLQGVLSEMLGLLHEVSLNLTFWKAKAKGSRDAKLRFMLLERGPSALLLGVLQYSRSMLTWRHAGADRTDLAEGASSRIVERINMLSTLQARLAAVVGEVYTQGRLMAAEATSGKGARGLSSAVMTVRNAMLGLEDIYDFPQADFSESAADRFQDTDSLFLNFQSEPTLRSIADVAGGTKDAGPSRDRAWSNETIRHGLATVLDDARRVKDTFSSLVAAYRRPHSVTRHWLRYSGAAVGLGVAALWAARHSALMGSDDLSRWSRQGGEAVTTFKREHIDAPLGQLSDELFQTFRSRPRGIVENDEVALTRASLRRMLVAFAEREKNRSPAESMSDSEMMEIVVSKYEKELVHPLQSLLGGELARALLIQVQKLKLELETALLELDQVMRANEINFALLAIMPAILLLGAAGYGVQQLLSNRRGAEGRGRAARHARRMLLADVEKAVLACLAEEWGKDFQGDDIVGSPQARGLIIYTLDRLYRACRRSANKTTEWPRLRQDLLDLGSPTQPLSLKLSVCTRLAHMYDCLAPWPDRR